MKIKGMFVLSSHPMNSRFLHAYCFIFYVVLLYLTWFVLDIVIRRSSNTCVNSSNKYTSIKIYTNCSQLYIFQNGLRTYNREYIYIKHKLNTFLKDKKLLKTIKSLSPRIPHEFIIKIGIYVKQIFI